MNKLGRRRTVVVAVVAAVTPAGALGGCGGDDGVTDTDEPVLDGAPRLDAPPPDGALGDISIGDLTVDQLVVLCEDVTSANPGIAVGLGDTSCLGEDCEASATAIEDCAAASPDQPFECAEFGSEDFSTCAEPASELSTCLAAFLDQYTAYAEPLCATVDELPPFNKNPATVAGCEPLAAACPQIF